MCTAQDDQLAPTIVSDGGTGAIITWFDGRRFAFGDDIYVQRIDATGTSQWAPDGLALCTAADDQQYPTIAIDGAGAHSLPGRTGAAGTNNDIYVQHVNGSGLALSVPGENQASGMARAWPNPFRDHVRLALVLPTATTVRSGGLRCPRAGASGAYEPGLLAAGEHALTWDGRSSDGHPAGQGIYFLRVTGLSISLSRAVVRLQ